MTVSRFIPPPQPWELPQIDDRELLALKALKTGTANAQQQTLALQVIIYKIACTWDMSFRPGGGEGDRATIFAEGKRFVGARIVEAIERPMKGTSDAGTNTDSSAGEAAGRRNPNPERPKAKPAKPAAG